jgi:hypothetical protein
VDIKEIINLAMEALILRKQEPVVSREELAEIDKKLKFLGELLAVEIGKYK